MKSILKFKNFKTKSFILSKSVYLLIFTVIFSLTAVPFKTSASYELPESTKLNAGGALIMSLGITPEEDSILFEKNINAKFRPAALVHIMVGLTAVRIAERDGIDLKSEFTTYTNEHFNQIAGTGITTANIKIGDEWNLYDLLYVSLIRTSGDAAVMLADKLGGTMQAFIDEMNSYAVELGCENTSFANVLGTDHISQYTTPLDMAKIMRYVIDNKTVSNILSTNTYKCGAKGSTTPRTFTGSNTLLGDFEPLVFGKAGTTSAEGSNFASYHQKSGYNYICIILGSENSEEKSPHFKDTKTLVNWAINEFTYKTILKKNEPVTQLDVDLAWNKDYVTLIPSKPFAATLKNDLDLATIEHRITLLNDGKIDAPIEKGKVYGKIEFFIRVDEKLGEVDLIASEAVEASQTMVLWRKAKNVLGSFWFKLALILLAALFVIYVIINIIHNYKRRRNNQKKLKKYR